MRAASHVVIVLVLAACSGGAGDDDDDTSPDALAPDALGVDARPDAPIVNPGFNTPTSVTKANVLVNGVWTELGDADWSCLGTPSFEQPSTGAIALAGRVRDFEHATGVGNAAISAWSTSPSATVGNATSSDVAASRGDFSISLAMLPSGTRRYSFTLSAAGYITTRVVERYYTPGASATDDLVMFSLATAQALPPLIGVVRDDTKALYFGTVVDCGGRAVSNAVVGISAVPTVFQDGAGLTYYFAASSPNLPVRHTVEPVLNNDGVFAIFNAAPDTYSYLQVWGFRTPGELAAGSLTLLGELLVLTPYDHATMLTVTPRRT